MAFRDTPTRSATAAPVASAAAALEVQSLALAYGGTNPLLALQALDLVVEASEFHALLGPSGCGKSTLLKVVAGLIPASQGTIALPGDGTVAYVPQGNSCFPWLRAEDNVAYGLRLRGVGRAERRVRARALLAALGLSQFAHSFPAQLSEGMRQRVSIARAFAIDAPLLLMDEPLSALDFQTKNAVQAELLQLWRDRRCAVVYVTHDIDEALTLADRVSVLSARPGRVLETIEVPFSRPRDHASLREHPQYAALFRRLYTLLETP